MTTTTIYTRAIKALSNERASLRYQLEEAKGFQYHAMENLLDGSSGDTMYQAIAALENATRARLECERAYRANETAIDDVSNRAWAAEHGYDLE